MNVDLLQEVLGTHLVHQGERQVAGSGHHYLGRAQRGLGGGDERVDRCGVADVEVVRERLTAVARDLRGEGLALLDATGAQSHRKAEFGKRFGSGRADAGGGPGDQGGPAVGVGFEPGHYRTSTVMGSLANPRTFVECTRSMPASTRS